MYNLFVSGWEDQWKGDPCVFDASRCVHHHEYTDEQIAEQYGALDASLPPLADPDGDEFVF